MPLRTVRSAMTTMNGAAVADAPQGRRQSARLTPLVTCATAPFLVAKYAAALMAVRASASTSDISVCCSCPIIVVQRPQSVRSEGGLKACVTVPANVLSVPGGLQDLWFLALQQCCHTSAIGATRGLQFLFVGYAAARALRRAAVKYDSTGKAAWRSSTSHDSPCALLSGRSARCSRSGVLDFFWNPTEKRTTAASRTATIRSGNRGVYIALQWFLHRARAGHRHCSRWPFL